MNKTFIVISILIVVVIFLVFVAVYLKPFGAGTAKKIFTVGGQTFEVGIADNALTRTQGLSGRPSLGENEGLLFIFPTAGNYGFWMKGMNFPIDIVGISGDSPSQILPGKTWEGKIVGFSENLQPEPKKSVFSLSINYPPEAVDKVLEINAGSVAKYGLKVGDAFSLK